jgi:hypothetical protein
MARYAENTHVDAKRSRDEIERTLQRYNAMGFAYGWEQREVMKPAYCNRYGCRQVGQEPTEVCYRDHAFGVVKSKKVVREVAIIQFKVKNRAVKLEVPMPTQEEEGTATKHEKAVRQRWRALSLVLKAKLEAVESGISTFDHEFLAHMVMANGLTVGQALIPRLTETVERGLLLGPAQET